MYRVMYKKHGENEWSCLGAYAEQMVAIEALDRFEQSILGDSGEFKLVREGDEDE